MLGFATAPQAQRAATTISQQTTLKTRLELTVLDENDVHSNAGVFVTDAQAVEIQAASQQGVGKYLFEDVDRKVVIRFPDRGITLQPVELVLDEVAVVSVTIALDGQGGVKSIIQKNVKTRNNPFDVKPISVTAPGSASGPPGNDDCASATPIFDGVTPFSTVGATTDGPADASCQFDGQTYEDIWFTYTATCDGDLLVSTCGTAAYDTDLVVYDGTDCGALSLLACNDDTTGCAGFTSEVEVPVVAGNDYLIRVGGFDVDDEGTGDLTITCTPSGGGGDDNFECDTAAPIACGDSVTQNNDGATDNDPVISCRVGGGDTSATLWFKFVATDTEAFITSEGIDTVLAVYDGDCGSLTEIACNDDDPSGDLGLGSAVCVEGLTVDNTYYIQVGSWSTTTRGDITLSITCPCPAPPVGRCCLDLDGTCVETTEDDCLNVMGGESWDEGLNCTDDPCPVAPDNNLCEDAEMIAVPFTGTFDNTAATTDGPAVPCGVASGPWKNVWYKVTGTGGTFTATTCSAGTVVTDTKISVFCADCDTLPCVDGNDDDCTVPPGTNTFQSTVSWCTQAGAEYLISVGNFSDFTTPGVIELTVTDGGGSCTPDVFCIPVGACCIFDGACGTCVELTEAECMAAGGVYNGDGTVCSGNLVADPSFEDGGIWSEGSTNFGVPTCTVGLCGTGGGTPPFDGDVWVWFGGISGVPEFGFVEQTLSIPMGSDTMTFWYQHPVASGNGVDIMNVLVDGGVVASFPEGVLLDPLTWTQISVNIAAFADGGSHTIRFEGDTNGFDGIGAPAVCNFFVDLVEIESAGGLCDPTCVTVDFSTEDDFSTVLADGQDLSTPPEFGNLFDLSGAGANEGPAIFDSSAGGPNDPGAGVDLDLIVDQGNILILQDSNSDFQSVAGFFDVPNDAKFGGSLIFSFNQGTLCESIDLIDVDNVQPDSQTATVTLTDGNGLQRVYSAPDGFTEDITTQGGTGVRTLDLTTLAAQAGFAASATATEDAGFNPCNVVTLEVNLAGSSAVDNLSICTQ